MPYLSQADRMRLLVSSARTPGELNYELTMALRANHGIGYLRYLCLKYVELAGGPSYTNFNTVMGVLECARREHIRRDWLGGEIQSSAGILSNLAEWFYDIEVAPYEDAKIKENGDV